MDKSKLLAQASSSLQSSVPPDRDPLYLMGTAAYAAGNILLAIQFHKQAADKGNCESLYELGAFYDLGKGVPQNYHTAQKYYAQAAAKGSAKALGALGVLYYYGRSVPQDYAKAHDYYQQSLAKGNEYVLYNIGILYERGRGVSQDYVKARKYYEGAAANGNADALNNLGVFYLQGYGVNRDYQKAQKYFEKAQAGGSKDALTNLASLKQLAPSGDLSLESLFGQMLAQVVQPGGEVPLIINNPPKTLWYAEKPIALGGRAEYISADEFMRRYVAHGGKAFEYTETIWCKPRLIQSMNAVDRERKYAKLQPFFESCLRTPQQLTDKLIITFINPDVGFGVFAREKIAAEQIICFYAGIFTYGFGEQSLYAMGSHNLPDYIIDAQAKGGIARFFQHMPISIFHRYHDEYLSLRTQVSKAPTFTITGFIEKLRTAPLISPEIFTQRYAESCPGLPFLQYESMGDGNVATVNVNRDIYIYDGLPIIFMYAERDIEAGEQLGITYGTKYWEEMLKLSPILFGKTGNILGVTEYCASCKMVSTKLLQCAKCKTTFYCGPECQRKDWPTHKLSCGKK